MNRKVVIHQPDFAPYLGFFHRFCRCDLYIVLDHVQFVTGTSRSWTHRDKIKTPRGEKWISLSVKKAPHDTAINRIELSDTVDWASDNLNLLEANYRNAAYFTEIMPEIRRLYDNPPRLMADFNMRTIEWLMDALDTRIPFVFSSTLDPQGAKNELLVDLLTKVGANHYLSGTGARGYMDEAVFGAAGICVEWQSFHHPVYPQLFDGFIPYLSSFDALFNCGVVGARRLLKESR